MLPFFHLSLPKIVVSVLCTVSLFVQFRCWLSFVVGSVLLFDQFCCLISFVVGSVSLLVQFRCLFSFVVCSVSLFVQFFNNHIFYADGFQDKSFIIALTCPAGVAGAGHISCFIASLKSCINTGTYKARYSESGAL